jgi:hypothetical protein
MIRLKLLVVDCCVSAAQRNLSCGCSDLSPDNYVRSKGGEEPVSCAWGSVALRIFVIYHLAETIIFDGRRVEYRGGISFLVCAPWATEKRGVRANHICMYLACVYQ